MARLTTPRRTRVPDVGLKTPKKHLTTIDPFYLVEFGAEAIEHHPDYMAVIDGRWAVCQAWKVLRGPNAGAIQIEHRWMRWWHPGDVLLFVRDRRKARRDFGGW